MSEDATAFTAGDDGGASEPHIATTSPPTMHAHQASPKRRVSTLSLPGLREGTARTGGGDLHASAAHTSKADRKSCILSLSLSRLIYTVERKDPYSLLVTSQDLLRRTFPVP